jgi:hypothetical protein
VFITLLVGMDDIEIEMADCDHRLVAARDLQDRSVQ